MKSRYLALATLLVLVGCAGSRSTPESLRPIGSADSGEVTSDRASIQSELIVFQNPTDSPVANAFASTQLPELRKIAAEGGLRLVLNEVRDGAPSEIAITPSIVFQNHRGRSIYQGRTSNLDRITNFIRTSRSVPQGAEPLERREVFVRELGRATIALSIKVTDLAGTVPDGFDSNTLRTEVREAITRTLTEYRFAPRVELGRADRTFYLDFYPFRSEADECFVTGAVFSQFDCHEPIATTFDAPTQAAWSDRATAFDALAKQLETAVSTSIASPATGDGFDPVPTSVAVKTWQQLGLDLPAAPPTDVAGDFGPVELATRWVLAPEDPVAGPRLTFKFAAPLDNYAGEVRQLESRLSFGSSHGFDSLTGGITADATSVTMGDPDLDQSLQASDTLHTAEHPVATFTIEQVDANDPRLEFGALHTVVLTGSFTMRGRTIPVTARASFEPLVNATGTAELRVSGTFELRLKEPFDIYGPDGPAPANDTLRFNFAFRYRPDTA